MIALGSDRARAPCIHASSLHPRYSVKIFSRKCSVQILISYRNLLFIIGPIISAILNYSIFYKNRNYDLEYSRVSVLRLESFAFLAANLTRLYFELPIHLSLFELQLFNLNYN